jgi:hypothetical protein
MRKLRYTPSVLTGFCLCFLVSPGLRAQSSETSTGTNQELRQRLEDLQKQMNQLQGELARVQHELAESKSPPSTSAATVTPAEPEAAPRATGENGSNENAAGSVKNFFASTDVSGFVDGYYGYNFNQPHSLVTPYRSFEGPTNQFSLNMIELIFDRPADANKGRLGYRLAFGYGNAMNAVNAADPGGLGFAQYLKEGYLSYLAPVGKGLQVDFGKFVTPHGAEVIESKDNWNYTRGILFGYAIPFYHFGVRTKYTFNDKVWMAGYLVNGWNNIVDNNSGKTYGASIGWSPSSKFSLVQNYMAGPEMTGTNSNWRQLSDTVVTLSPTSRLSFMLNYDYGRGDRVAGLLNPVNWQGWAGYVRYAMTDHNAFAARYEWYDDPEGFTTGVAQQLKEFTTTYEHRIGSGFSTKLEFRRDYSNQPTFVKGSVPAAAQNTMAAGLVYAFDARE